MKQTAQVVDIPSHSKQADFRSSPSGLDLSMDLTDALLSLCKRFGKTTTRDDFLVGLPIHESALPKTLVKRALARVGLDVETRRLSTVTDADFPCCAALQGDRYTVILSADDDSVTLACDKAPTGDVVVDRSEFDADFSGECLVASLTLDDVQTRHIGRHAARHWFWSAFSSERHLVRDIVLGTLVANLLAVGVSLFALQVYDRVIPNHSEATLWVLVVGALIAIVCEGTLRVARSHLLDVAGRRIELATTSLLFTRLMGARPSHERMGPGSLAYSMREYGSVREFFTAASIGSVADIPFVGIFLLLIFGIAGDVVWVIVAGMALIIVPSLVLRKTLSRLAAEMQGGTSAASRHLTEVCYALQTIKAHSGESLFQRRWEEIISLNAHKTSEQRLVSAALTFWSMGIQQASYIGAVVAGVYMVFAGNFTVGTIIAVSILSSRSIAPITQLAGTIARWEQVKTALNGLDHIATAEQDRSPDRHYARRKSLDGDIVMRDVSYRYHPDLPASLIIGQLHITEGDRLCLLGRNGSGKSTLLNAISGLYHCDSGSITVGGMDLRQIDPVDVRRNIGYLPQDVKLFTGTLRENVTFGNPHIDEDTVIAATVFSGLDKAIRHHPLGLDLPIVDGGGGLSVGQRQSVGLARLYVQNPKIVLLDEPTASLDQNAETELINTLDTWLEGRTCILTTHRAAALRLARTTAVLANGNIAMHGKRDDIIAQLQPAGEKHHDRAHASA